MMLQMQDQTGTWLQGGYKFVAATVNREPVS
jgi:hypothetical protein